MAILADHVPEFDATVVSRLRQAGAVILGKLNQTEGAMGGYNRHFKLPRNPWNEKRWTGASSSGSGVATATGMAYATLGSDTGGSIRFPSAACGIVGLKPTWGRVSRCGVFPLAESLDHVGPMTRSTADCAYVLEVIAGHDEHDLTSLPGKPPRYSQELGKSIEGLVIGWDENYSTDGVHPELTAALQEALEVLRILGAKIKPIRLPDLRSYRPDWFTLASSDALGAHAEFYPQRASEYGPYFREFLDIGTKVTGSQYAGAHRRRLECRGALAQAFQEIFRKSTCWPVPPWADHRCR
jgi:amidase